MNYDSYQHNEMAKHIVDLCKEKSFSQEMQSLLMLLGQPSSIVLESQDYVKSLQLQFPGLFSLGVDSPIVQLSMQLSSFSPSVIGLGLLSTIPSSLLQEIEQLQEPLLRNFLSAAESSDIENTSDCLHPDNYIELSDSFAELAKQLDNSLELPSPDENNIVKVSKMDRGTLLSLLGIICSILIAMFNFQATKANSEVNAQQHAESLEQDQRQHEELMAEERKQTHLLEQIEKNTSIDSTTQDSISSTMKSE